MNGILGLMILLPLAGSILNGLILRTPFPKRAGVIGTLFAGGSFVCAVLLWVNLMSTHTPVAASTHWVDAGALHLDWAFRFDWLTAVMALVVTGIGTVIHLYSIGYMSEDRSPARFFAYLNLFLFNMLVLISSDSLPGLFVGWEGVGLCSYLLIGFWYEDVEKANAGIKAFIVNRIGDAGFLIGIFLCYHLFHTLTFPGMAESIAHLNGVSPWMLSATAFCLFVGATGKSAQIPLYVWLPDAMAGPTPVSALIHAATMVTSGVYLIIRTHFLFELTPDVGFIIAVVGGVTSLMAALIATSQNDIKKVLAYSTVSQLGLMFLALGCGAYVAALFHVITHAFFKACLFLGAGSVIHGLHGEQDMTHMGGLRKEMPVTFWTFTIATIAIAGIPPLAGFFSKDLILYSSLTGEYGWLLWGLGSVASLLTAFYMARLLALTFFGTYRGHAHAHESPSVMTIPLIILAVGSVFAGLLNMPESFHALPPILTDWLAPVIHPTGEHAMLLPEAAAMGIATAVAFLATGFGLWLYMAENRGTALASLLKPLRIVFANKFWIDEIYGFVFVKPFKQTSLFLARFFDPKIVDGLVLLPSRVCQVGATALSFLQIGSVQFYLLVMLLGGLMVFWFSIKGALI